MKIAIIPARGGSKRIPKKNIKDFLGKPLIAYSIDAAVASGLFDTVMVSTDCDQIADIAKNLGAEVPFLRSDERASDYATTSDVLAEVIERYGKQSIKFEYFCCIYPTAPFLTSNVLQKSFDQMVGTDSDTVFSMCRFGYPIQRAFKQNGKYSEMIWPENRDKRSQDLETVFHDAGQFYWCKVERFLNDKVLFGNKVSGYELSELEVQDIDNQVDWDLAEIKYKRLFGLK